MCSKVQKKRFSKSAKKLTEYSNHVIIHLHKGSNLISMDFNGFSDPFCKFIIGEESVKSTIKKKTLNPIWNEHLVIFVDAEYLATNGVLKLQVWDHDMLKKNDFMGEALFDLKTLVKEKPTPVVFKLSTQGTIEATITAVNFGLTTEKPKIEERFLTDVENPYQVVLEKLENSKVFARIKRDCLAKTAENLSNPESLKKSYLTINLKDTIELAKKCKDDDDEDDEIENLSDEIFKHPIKIKIVITDQIRADPLQKGIRSFLSPILSKIEVSPKMGIFHSALVIGPWLIEWNNSALCIPRRCGSRAALLSADIEAIYTTSDLNRLVDKLAEVVVRWNISMRYKQHGGDKSKYGNCQDFVDAVLKKLGISLNFKGPLGEYLSYLRSNGRADLSFKMSDEFIKKFKITERVKVFKTHEELDTFVHYLFSKDLNFDVNHKEEYQFLKAFDRAFWMRNFKCEDDKRKIKTAIEQNYNLLDVKGPEEKKELEKNITNLNSEYEVLEKNHLEVSPLMVIEEDEEDHQKVLMMKCPFKDPRETFSVIF